MGAEDVKDAKPHETAQLLGGTAIKPKGWDRKGLEAVKYLIWNPDTGEFLTRTPLSWAKITVFYIIYYSCLAGFWAAAMAIFFQTIPNYTAGPKWTQNSSIIGTNPGLGAKPPNSDLRIDSSIYKFSISDNSINDNKECGNVEGGGKKQPCGEGDTTADWIKRMDDFLKKKDKEGVKVDGEAATGTIDCSKDATEGNPPKKIENKIRHEKANCKYDMEAIKAVCPEKDYGYIAKDGKIEPCIFLKFNTIWGWPEVPLKPIRIDKAVFDNPKYEGHEEFSTIMTEELRTEIKKKEGEQLDYIWVDCHGRYPADKEVLAQQGSITYTPKEQGIGLKYFPYQGTAYGTPIVAVKFKNLPVGQLVHVECRAWFHGVVHNSRDKEGLTQFEILITK